MVANRWFTTGTKRQIDAAHLQLPSPLGDQSLCSNAHFFAPLLIPDLTFPKKRYNARSTLYMALCAILPTLENTVSCQTGTTEFYRIVPNSFSKILQDLNRMAERNSPRTESWFHSFAGYASVEVCNMHESSSTQQKWCRPARLTFTEIHINHHGYLA